MNSDDENAKLICEAAGWRRVGTGYALRWGQFVNHESGSGLIYARDWQHLCAKTVGLEDTLSRA